MEDEAYEPLDGDGTDGNGEAKGGGGLSKNKTFQTMMLEDDDFYKKWAGPLILGPFPIAIMSILNIVCGELVIYTWKGTCAFPLDSFISATVAMSYLFLLIYSWVFLGDIIRLQIDKFKIDRVVMWPFKSMKLLMFLYFGLGFTCFIVWIVGSALLNVASFCKLTAPGLYSYISYLLASFWITFVVVIGYIIKMTYGKNIWGFVQQMTKPPTLDEMEEVIFRKQFSQYDKTKEGRIVTEDLPPILTALGVYVPDEEIPTLLKTLDPSGSGSILFDDMFSWFKKLQAQLNADDDGNNDGEGK